MTRAAYTSMLIFMQARTPSSGSLVENRPYDARMARTSNKPRPPQGAHIYKLRLEAGLTQTELAEFLGENQANISFWERSEKPPRSDVLPKMAKAFGVSVEDLLLPEKDSPRRRNGPVGKLQRTFEKAAQLPRSQQEKLVELIETFMRGMQTD